MVYVNYDDVKAFCDWADLQLPTEAEWEKAARGTDGRIWPWGNETPTLVHCNFSGANGGTTPVSQYSPEGDSPYGCVDMSGNVREFTAAWYNLNRSRPLRGGAWDDDANKMRVDFRQPSFPYIGDPNVGFRVVEHPLSFDNSLFDTNVFPGPPF